MTSLTQYKPIPWFLPAIIALMVLSVLFWFGLKEQGTLFKQGIEETVQQRMWISEQVGKKITETLLQTKASAERFSKHLSKALTPPSFDSENKFNLLFESLPDGSIRSIKKNYDPLTEAGVWIPKNHQMSLKNKALFIQAKNIVETYGQGAQQQPYVDTWFMPKSGGIVIYWPEEKEFIYQAEASFNYNNTDWLLSAQPENNPEKKSYWTKLSLDPVPKVWMLSAVSPIYHDDTWLGSVGHDIPLERILASTQLLQKQSHSRFILISDKQGVIASDIYVNEIKNSHGNIELSDLPDNNWRKAIDKSQQENIKTIGHASYQFDNELYTVTFIKEQNWLLVTSIPLAEIKKKISHSFQNLQNIAIGSISLEILIVSMILAWGHKKNTRYVNELHGIHNALRQEKSRYKNLVNNISSMVYRCRNDETWTMEFINGACSDITGYSAEDFINNKCIEFGSIIHQEDKHIVWQQVQNALKEKKIYEIVFRIRHKDSSIHWMLERGQGVFDEDGTLMNLEGVITDITKLKHAEIDLQRLNNDLDNIVKDRTTELESTNSQLREKTLKLSSSLQQLQQTQKQLIESEKIASLNHLVVGMAHELNTPLGNLLVLSSVLEDKMEYIKENVFQRTLKRKSFHELMTVSSKALISMKTNIKKMIILSDNFKEIAVPDEMQIKKTNLKNEILNAVKDLDGELNDKSITVNIDIPDNVEVECHVMVIFQIFNQLLTNSIVHAYTDKSSGIINIACDCNQEELVLLYSDDGHGIPKGIEKHIFEPFTTSARGQGSIGLGLNVIYNLVSVGLKGEIKYIGQHSGTAFKINIPTSNNL